jgi:hypothetical protein
VVDPVEQFRRDPQTAPIPIIPAPYAAAPPIDPYVPASFVEPTPPPSPTEVTMCWSPGAEPAESWGAPGWTAHDPHHAPGYEAVGYEPARWDDAGYGVAGYDPGYAAG